jgi:hypothetical protein
MIQTPFNLTLKLALTPVQDLRIRLPDFHTDLISEKKGGIQDSAQLCSQAPLIKGSQT